MALHAHLVAPLVQRLVFHSCVLVSCQLRGLEISCECLDDQLKFQHQPNHTGIPVGGTLVSVSHHMVNSLSDLHKLKLRDRIWLRIRDPGSSRRKLSDDSHRVIKLFQEWISGLQPIRSLRPRPCWQGHAAADAMAVGHRSQIGGFVTNHLGQSKWFLQVFTHSETGFAEKHYVSRDTCTNCTSLDDLEILP